MKNNHLVEIVIDLILNAMSLIAKIKEAQKVAIFLERYYHVKLQYKVFHMFPTLMLKFTFFC